MRKELLDLIKNTIIYKYDLPNSEIGISKSIFSTENDKCYTVSDVDSIANIIYNSIVEYSFNNFDIQGKDYNDLHSIALQSKLKYNESASPKSKISYGFHGETLLHCILYVLYNANPLISRGYFYNPLESSETKGYDSYQLIEHNGTTELWFGEVKFRATHTSCINSALDNIEKAISDQYLSKNILAMSNFKANFNINGSVIETIISEWEKNPSIKIQDEISKYDLKLVYPMIMLYNKGTKEYDDKIKESIKHIEDNFSKKIFPISIDYSIYFIWMPVDNVKKIKSKVIEWIDSKKPLM